MTAGSKEKTSVKYAAFTEGSVGRHLFRLGSFMAMDPLSMNLARFAEAIHLGFVGTEALPGNNPGTAGRWPASPGAAPCGANAGQRPRGPADDQRRALFPRVGGLAAPGFPTRMTAGSKEKTSVKYAGFTEGSVGRHLFRLGSFMAMDPLSMNLARFAEAIYLGFVGTEALPGNNPGTAVPPTTNAVRCSLASAAWRHPASLLA